MNEHTKTKKHSNTSTDKVGLRLMFIMYNSCINCLMQSTVSKIYRNEH